MGIVNGIANAMGIVVPMVVALLVDGNVRDRKSTNFKTWSSIGILISRVSPINV